MGFWDDLTGKSASNAANAAAQDTYGKQQEAIKELQNYGDRNRQQYQQLSTKYDPYVQAGGNSLQMLQNGLGLNGAEGGQAFTQAYQALPGYTEGLQTGQQGVLNASNAAGRLNSGATLKAAARFGSDYENMRSGDYLTRLMGLGGMGQSATQQQVNTVGQGLQNQLATRNSGYLGGMQAANTIGLGQVAGANAMQQGSTNLLGAGMQLGGMALGGMGGGVNLGSLFGGGGGTSGWVNGSAPQGTGANLGGYGGSWG